MVSLVSYAVRVRATQIHSIPIEKYVFTLIILSLSARVAPMIQRICVPFARRVIKADRTSKLQVKARLT